MSGAGAAGLGVPHIHGRPPGCCSPCHGSNGGGRGRSGASGRLRAALGRFLLGTGGAAAIETAWAVAVLVVAFAGIATSVNSIFTDDAVGRAARAAARALALDPDADPWKAVHYELDGGAPWQCTTDWSAADSGTCSGWELAVVHGVTPAALAAVLGAGPMPPSVDGGLVVVGLARGSSSHSQGSPWTVRDVVEQMDGIGVARVEPDA